MYSYFHSDVSPKDMKTGIVAWNTCFNEKGNPNLYLEIQSNAQSEKEMKEEKEESLPDILLYLVAHKNYQEKAPAGAANFAPSSDDPFAVLPPPPAKKEIPPGVPYGYIRFKMKETIAKGWDVPPSWNYVKVDPCYKLIPPGFPLGSILFSLRCGYASQVPPVISERCRPFAHTKTKGDLSLKINGIQNLEINKRFEVSVFCNENKTSDVPLSTLIPAEPPPVPDVMTVE